MKIIKTTNTFKWMVGLHVKTTENNKLYVVKIWCSELILKNILKLKNNLQKAWGNFRSQISTRFSPFSSSFFHQLWPANACPVAFATSKTTWIPSPGLPFFSNESWSYSFPLSKKGFEDSCRVTADGSNPELHFMCGSIFHWDSLKSLWIGIFTHIHMCMRICTNIKINRKTNYFKFIDIKPLGGKLADSFQNN